MFPFKNNLPDKVKKVVRMVVIFIFMALVIGLFLFSLTALVCMIIKNTTGYCNDFIARVIEMS